MINMKKALFILGFIVLFLTIANVVLAQQSGTKSNTVVVEVGNPPKDSSCPIPGAKLTCGTKDNPKGGCGHCNASYVSTWSYLADICKNEKSGLAYGLDVTGSSGTAADGTPALLPKANGKNVDWTFVEQEKGTSGFIQKYKGIDADSKSYWLQLHHTEYNSGVGNSTVGATAKSGDTGGKICCGESHVHVQLGTTDTNGVITWQDPTQYFCQTNAEETHYTLTPAAR